MARSGFRAYCVYLFVKNLHFKDNDFNVMRITTTPMKDKLIDSWNKKRRLQDGKKFQAIEEKSNNIKSLALLYASYFMSNASGTFYVQEMFEDDFRTYKRNIAELRSLQNVFSNDLETVVSYCKENKVKVKDLLVGKTTIPQVFKMNLSWNSLVILNDMFNIIEINSDIQVNILEKERWNTIKIKLKKYKPIIQDYLSNTDWKEITKELLT